MGFPEDEKPSTARFRSFRLFGLTVTTMFTGSEDSPIAGVG